MSLFRGYLLRYEPLEPDLVVVPVLPEEVPDVLPE